MAPKKQTLVRHIGLAITWLSILALVIAGSLLLVQLWPVLRPVWGTPFPQSEWTYSNLYFARQTHVPWLLFIWLSLGAMGLGHRLLGRRFRLANLIRG